MSPWLILRQLMQLVNLRPAACYSGRKSINRFYKLVKLWVTAPRRDAPRGLQYLSPLFPFLFSFLWRRMCLRAAACAACDSLRQLCPPCVQLVARCRDPDTSGGCARPAACVRRCAASDSLCGEMPPRGGKPPLCASGAE